MNRIIKRRPAVKSQPPVAVPTQSVTLRTSKIRLAAGDPVKYQRSAKLWKTRHPPNVWKTLEITIPMEVVKVAGLEEGMTMVFEGYASGVVKMSPAGDLLSRDEEAV